MRNVAHNISTKLRNTLRTKKRSDREQRQSSESTVARPNELESQQLFVVWMTTAIASSWIRPTGSDCGRGLRNLDRQGGALELMNRVRTARAELAMRFAYAGFGVRNELREVALRNRSGGSRAALPLLFVVVEKDPLRNSGPSRLGLGRRADQLSRDRGRNGIQRPHARALDAHAAAPRLYPDGSGARRHSRANHEGEEISTGRPQICGGCTQSCGRCHAKSRSKPGQSRVESIRLRTG